MDRASSVLRNLWMVSAMLLLLARVGAAEVDMAATLSFGPMYAPETWIPLKVEVHNRGTETLDGTIRVTPQNPLTPEFRSPIRVPGQAKVRTTMWVRLPLTSGKQAEVAGVTLHDGQGARVQISEVVGRSMVSAIAHQRSGLANSGCLVAVNAAGGWADDNHLPEQVASAMELAMDWKAPIATVDATLAPQASQLYSSAYVVMLMGMDPRVLDPAQRRAILDYVIGGGVLLLAQPEPEQMAGSWLEPYLPVRLVGTRQMHALALAGQERPVAFAQWVPVTEAIAGEGTVLWQDAELVHAAYRTLGLGRVVFTSFPAGAMSAEDQNAKEKVAAVWRDLLRLDRPAVGVHGSRIASGYGKLMEPMLGRRAASWKLAISAACAIVLLTVGAQFIWRGAARPRAFAVSLGLSVLLAVGFTGMSMFRQESEPLQHVVLSVADVSPDGSTVQQYSAFAGPRQQLSQVATSNFGTVCPVLLRDDRPVVSQWPAHLAPISVTPEQVKQVTLAQGMLPGITGAVRAQFTQEGLRLDVENGIGADLGSAQLVWGLHRLTAGQFPSGQSRRVLTGADLRPAQEFAATSGVASQDQLQKGEIVRALLQSPNVSPGVNKQMPSLIAFADRLPVLTAPEGAQIEQEAQQSLVRMRVEVVPSEGGTPVRIDGCFNRITSEPTQHVPFYSFGNNEFVRTSLQGAWGFCIEPPAEIGAIRPGHARVRIDLASPQHKITLRRGQCRDGTHKADRNGAIIGQWDGQVGLQSIELDCNEEDFDAQGRLWFMLEAQQSGQAGTLGVDPHWRIEQLQVDLEGQVRGK